MQRPRVVVAYGSTYGDTADAAERIADAWQRMTGCRPAMLDVAYADVAALADFDLLVLGCSTWNVGELQGDWEAKVGQLESLDLHGKRIALFGAGDQLGYPDTFVDALGILAEVVERRGAELLGLWPAAGYRHAASRAQRQGRFVGLAIDATSEHERTGERVEHWVRQLGRELGRAGGGGPA